MKLLKNKQININLSPLPEVKIPGKLGRFIHTITHIHPIFCLAVTIIILAIFLKFMPYAVWITLWKGIKAQIFLVGSLVAFSLLAISLVWKTGQKIDVWVFMCFNKRGKRSEFLDWLVLGFTQVGNGIFAFIIAFILYLRVQHLLAYELILGNLTLWLMVELLKLLVRRSRPYSKLTDIRIIGDRARGHSFPSGHTSQAFFLAALMTHYFNAGVRLAFLLYGIAFIVGLTRMYVGMHYPRDILGGIVLGTSWGLLGVIINSYIFSQFLNIHLIGI